MEPGTRLPMIVYMRGVWGLLPKVGALGFVFVCTVGAVDRIRCHDSFNPIVIDAQLDSRVNAYVPLVKATKEHLKISHNDPRTVRWLAKLWSDAARSGKIQQIYPGYCGESLIDGPKSDIFSSCSSVANRLSEIAEKEEAAHNPLAYEDALTSIELINIVRFGNYETLFTASAYLRRPSKILKRNLSKLTPDLIARLRSSQDPTLRSERTEQLSQVSRRLLVQYTARYGSSMAKQDDINYAFFLGQSGKHVAANHFYGFDKEVGLTASKTQ